MEPAAEDTGRDLPGRLLAFLVRRLPSSRETWGAAMLSELGYVHGRSARWRFALGCVSVVLFPPPEGAGMMPGLAAASLTVRLSVAAAISTALVAPLVLLDLRHNPLTRQDLGDFSALFGLLWVLPAVFVVVAMPVVRTVATRGGVLLRPGVFLLQVAALLVLAAMWAVIVADQMPCFLGAPNCD